MTDSGFDASRFEKLPVLGIIRGITDASLQGVLEAVAAAGLHFVEITLNTPDAARLIEKSVKNFSGSLCIGAGTVLNLADAKTAVDSGARFCVAPTLNEAVAGHCREQNTAYFPGALTPTEIEKAWNAGAEMVKVFPASQVGSGYFRTVKGPFEKLKLLAVGGVNAKNAAEFLSSGADAVALGGSIISPSRMRDKEYDAIQKDIEDFLLAVKNFYSNIP